jgi:laminin, alpha 1/2
MSDTIRNSGRINNEVSAHLTKLQNVDTKQSVKESAALIDKVSENLKNVEQEVDGVNESVSGLRKKLEDLDPEWDAKFGLAQENITKTLINIREANKTLNINEHSIMQQNEKFKEWNESMALRLQELRNKITKAKHAAESVSCTTQNFTIIHFY